MATLGHLPHGRGYDTSLHYFHHANDYFTERTHNVSDTCPHDVYPMKGGGCFVDMWDTTRPAVGQNGTAPPNGTGCEGYPVTGPEEEYEEFKFKRRVISTIEAHDAPVTALAINHKVCALPTDQREPRRHACPGFAAC